MYGNEISVRLIKHFIFQIQLLQQKGKNQKLYQNRIIFDFFLLDYGMDGRQVFITIVVILWQRQRV